ncbi:amino-acid N-acetyltransferase [Thiolinea disciformis]|uniref:amino-acid N-acetyltransferase n=1 Tax=Thiolinea disciformis TaxID=125614 RepID=UPI00037E20A1|nr:amino-acid N-acetyltransferase [Thiolinea disciformis]
MPQHMLNRTSVEFFREASPYIHKHRDKIFVIALPGEVVEQDYFRRILQDIAIIASLGTRVVLVHGTRPQIDNRLISRGQAIRFHNSLRITDDAALLAAQEACGFVRIQIENILTQALNPPGASSNRQNVISGNFVSARPVGVLDGVDYRHTGLIRRVSHNSICRQLEQHHIVLLSPLGYSPTGEAYNLRYEQLAIETAQALQADKVLLLSPIPVQLPAELTLEEAGQFRDQHELIPQIMEALQHKVGRVHLLDASVDGSLLMELYTRDGIGCMIAADAFEVVRLATVDDIKGIMEVIRPLEDAGTLVKRSREQIELEISKFQVIERDKQIIGCVALYDTADPKIGELACLAVHPHYRAANRGERLLQNVVKVARAQGKDQLLILTTQTNEWFRERGFFEAHVDDLPANKRQLYNYKRNSKVMFKKL